MIFERQLTDLGMTLEWNLVARRSVEANYSGGRLRVPPQNFVISSCVAAVGVRSSSAKINYWLAGYANTYFNFTPSSQSEYVAAVRLESHRLKLGSLNLIMVPRNFETFFLELSFVPWLVTMDIEVWRYDGEDLSVFDKFP